MSRVQSEDVKLPNGFVSRLKNDDLKDLIERVWQRIPPAEREIIRDRLSAIYPAELARRGEGPIFEQTLASVGAVKRVITCNIELGDVLAHMWLDEAQLDKMSEQTTMAVIAHEFAHVFLAHQCYHKAREYQAAFDPLTAVAIESVHEWDADLHVWLWGFRQELVIRGTEHGRKEPPWFLTPECGQPRTEKNLEGHPGDKSEKAGE